VFHALTCIDLSADVVELMFFVFARSVGWFDVVFLFFSYTCSWYIVCVGPFFGPMMLVCSLYFYGYGCVVFCVNTLLFSSSLHVLYVLLIDVLGNMICLFCLTTSTWPLSREIMCPYHPSFSQFPPHSPLLSLTLELLLAIPCSFTGFPPLELDIPRLPAHKLLSTRTLRPKRAALGSPMSIVHPEMLLAAAGFKREMGDERRCLASRGSTGGRQSMGRVMEPGNGIEDWRKQAALLA
jgi:hypothetical protein